MVGRNPSMFKGPLTDPTISAKLKQSLREEDFWYGEIINYTKSGEAYKMEIAIAGIVIKGKRYYFAIKNKI
jgi:hypothetical protein